MLFCAFGIKSIWINVQNFFVSVTKRQSEQKPTISLWRLWIYNLRRPRTLAHQFFNVFSFMTSKLLRLINAAKNTLNRTNNLIGEMLSSRLSILIIKIIPNKFIQSVIFSLWFASDLIEYIKSLSFGPNIKLSTSENEKKYVYRNCFFLLLFHYKTEILSKDFWIIQLFFLLTKKDILPANYSEFSREKNSFLYQNE